MLTLLLSYLLFHGTCADLTGRYVIQGEDGYVEVIVTQEACLRASISWNTIVYDGREQTRRVLTLDGVFRPDSGLSRGAPQHSTASRFRGDTLEVLVRYLPPSTLADRRHQWFYLLPSRDLCFGSANGGGKAVVVVRVDARGLRAALGRSESANGGLTGSCS